MNSFATALHGLAGHCHLRDFKDLIHDHIDVGLKRCHFVVKRNTPDVNLENGASQKEALRK